MRRIKMKTCKYKELIINMDAYQLREYKMKTSLYSTCGAAILALRLVVILVEVKMLDSTSDSGKTEITCGHSRRHMKNW